MKSCPINNKTSCNNECKFLLIGGCAILFAARQAFDANEKIDKLKREIVDLSFELKKIKELVNN